MTQDQWIIAIVTTAFVLLSAWLLIGYINYRRFRSKLLWFKEKYHYYIYMEKNGGNMQTSVEFFNKREELVASYLFLYNEMKDMLEYDTYWSSIRLDYFIMGPLYNLF